MAPFSQGYQINIPSPELHAEAFINGAIVLQYVSLHLNYMLQSRGTVNCIVLSEQTALHLQPSSRNQRIVTFNVY